MRALLVTLVLALVIAVVGGASTLSAAQGSSAPVRTATMFPTLGVCTPAWGTPAICV